MELFIKECHERQKLVVHGSAIPRMLLDEFRRESMSTNELKNYGMCQYVLDAIQGPDPVLRYLCQTTKIHMIPIAKELTPKQIDDITKEKDGRIRRFFVKDFCVCRNLNFYLNIFHLFSIWYRFHGIRKKHQQQMFMYKEKNI
jgi:hypothetical protein